MWERVNVSSHCTRKPERNRLSVVTQPMRVLNDPTAAVKKKIPKDFYVLNHVISMKISSQNRLDAATRRNRIVMSGKLVCQVAYDRLSGEW